MTLDIVAIKTSFKTILDAANVTNSITFAATYTNSINGSWGSGVLTATAIGGASVLSGQLDLAHNDSRYLTVSATGNAAFTQTGCIRFRLTPNYSGNPAATKVFFSIGQSSSSANNLITLYHSASGGLTLSVKGSTGLDIIAANLGTWTPVSGTKYVFELNIDLTSGANRVFINGTQFGTTNTNTGTRNAGVLLWIGQYYSQIYVSNFYIDDFVIFNSVQHTANHDSTYTLPEILPYNLSTNLTTRIKNVFTVSPNTENMNASVIPAITIWTEQKQITMQDICKDQYYGKRKAIIDFNIAGVIWNNIFTTAATDNSDNEIERLMENIEEVLRRDSNLSGAVVWQHPTDITYHNLPKSEREHYKIGIATYQCMILY